MFGEDLESSRRVPRQRRSRETRDRVLDAAEQLLVEDGSAGLTTTRIAERAGVAVGSVYAYFADRDGVAEALALRHWQRFADVVAAAAEAEERDAAGRPLAFVVDALAAGFRGQPAFLALWFGDLRTERMRTATRPVREQVAASVQRALRVHWPTAPDDRLGLVARTTVIAGDGLLREAFRVDPDGDPTLLGEARTMLEAYAETSLA
jgi:AcrR family transcriptional regulator